MKRLYLAISTRESYSTMFIADDVTHSINEEARHFLKEEVKSKTYGQPKISVVEITSLDQVPDEWRGSALLWGTDEEITVADFFNIKNSDEYKEYLRLKEKFKGIDED